MEELEARIEALERAVTEGDHDLSELAAEGETRDRLAAVEGELGDLADRVAELEAATQALRGYVGNVRAVNHDVEQRADAALSKAESLESAIVEGADTHDCDVQPDRDVGKTGETTAAEDADTPGTAKRGHRQQSNPEGAGVDTRTVTSNGTHGKGHDGTHGDGHESEHGNRCQACGRPAAGAGEHDARGASPDSAGNHADGTSDGEQLDAVFERSTPPKNGDDGTFDRIRKML